MKMMENRSIAKFQKKMELDAVRLVANYLVVAIHIMILSGGALYAGLEYSFWNWISQSFAPIAMPTLFFISGYLFYVSKEVYVNKIRHRVGRLLIPYVSWNLIIGLLFVLFCIFGLYNASSFQFSSIKEIFTWIVRKSLSLWHAPANMPTWYIRTIFVYAILGPVWCWFYRGRYWVIRLIILSVGISVFEFWLQETGHMIDFIYTYPPYSLLCFVLGGGLAVTGIGIEWLYGKKRLFLGIIGVIALIVDITITCPLGLACWVKLFMVFILFAVAPELTKIYCWLPEVVRISGFWLYVTHLPIFMMLSSLLGKISFSSLTLQLCIGVVLMLMISIGSFVFIGKILPGVLKCLNGQQKI